MASASVDRRRANGPTTSAPIYTPLSDIQKAGPSSQPIRNEKESLSPRPLFLQTGLVPQSNGSAYLEAGNTKLACAVYGPRQVRGRNYAGSAELNVDVRFAPFAGRVRRKPGKDTESPALSSIIHTALVPSLRLDLLPKASIDVFITVLDSDSSFGSRDEEDMGCATHAATVASAALADAGIEMFGLVVGLGGILMSSEEASVESEMVVDPSAQESGDLKSRKGKEGNLSLWSMPALGTTTSIVQAGAMEVEEVDRLMTALQAASMSVHFVVAKALQEGFDAQKQVLSTNAEGRG